MKPETIAELRKMEEANRGFYPDRDTYEEAWNALPELLDAAEEVVEHTGRCPNCATQMEARWKDDVAAKDARIADLERGGKLVEAAVKDQRDTIVAGQKINNDLRADLATKDKEITRLRDAADEMIEILMGISNWAYSIHSDAYPIKMARELLARQDAMGGWNKL